MILGELAPYTDCSLCKELCYRALYSSKLDGFSRDKSCSISCSYLCSDHTCNTHRELKQRSVEGRPGYDCLGAGRFAIQGDVPANQDMFAVYRKPFSLHQMFWYLGGAPLQKEAVSFHGELQMLIQTLDTARRQPWKTILTADIDFLHEQTSRLLKETMQQKQLRHPSPHRHPMGKRFTNERLRSMGFSMKFLLATDSPGHDLQGSCFLGSDMWDCRIAGSGLCSCFFLTQMQLNAAISDNLTRLPNHLHIPAHWNTVS